MTDDTTPEYPFPPFDGAADVDPMGSARDAREADIRVPAQWPSAWAHLWQPARDRAVFVGLVVLLTVIGVVFTGDLVKEWWVPLVPLVLLTGPVSRPGRVRRTLQRAATRGRLRTTTGRLHPGPVTSRGPTVRLVTPSGHAVALPASRSLSYTLAGRYVSSSALLVWAPTLTVSGPPAALVLDGIVVAYLQRVPRGARGVRTPLQLTTDRATVMCP